MIPSISRLLLLCLRRQTRKKRVMLHEREFSFTPLPVKLNQLLVFLFARLKKGCVKDYVQFFFEFQCFCLYYSQLSPGISTFVCTTKKRIYALQHNLYASWKFYTNLQKIYMKQFHGFDAFLMSGSSLSLVGQVIHLLHN